jgi:hypothetical protein
MVAGCSHDRRGPSMVRGRRKKCEANEMPEHKRYNGENNIWATFSTPKYWNYSDGNFNDVPVYAVSSSAVRFDYPRVFNNRTTGYQPTIFGLMD